MLNWFGMCKMREKAANHLLICCPVMQEWWAQVLALLWRNWEKLGVVSKMKESLISWHGSCIKRNRRLRNNIGA